MCQIYEHLIRVLNILINLDEIITLEFFFHSKNIKNLR
jgi:hypothetical protein